MLDRTSITIDKITREQPVMGKSKLTPKKEIPGKVKVTPNGPYLVSGNLPLSEQEIRVDKDDQSHGWKEGRKYPMQESYALCRCGRSRHKPFCDGTHNKVKFDGTETANNVPYLKRAEKIEGPELIVTDVRDFCAAARFCDRQSGIRELTRESQDPEARKTAVEEACDCPSGRLIAWDKAGKAIEPEFEPSIGLVNDIQAGRTGPIWVRGGVRVESADGKIYEPRNRVTLCRCGRSANKPFCDGSHLH
jgi:CDGSH-type Zn-finger protein